MSEYEIGDTIAPSDRRGYMWIAGISRSDEGNRHGNQIEVYEKTKEAAEELRDFIFEAITYFNQTPIDLAISRLSDVKKICESIYLDGVLAGRELSKENRDE